MGPDQVTEEWIKSLERELESSRQTQNWAPGSTRSRWAKQLEPLLRAARGAFEFQQLLDEAEEEQYLLTEKVAQGMATADALLERCYSLEVVQLDDSVRAGMSACESLSELVAYLREHDISVDDETVGARDGFVVNKESAYVYASCRAITPEYLDYVCVDLLTGGIERW